MRRVVFVLLVQQSMCSDALGATSNMRTCASDCSFRLLGVIASLLNVSAFLQKNDRLTIQTNRFLAQIHEDFIVYGITQVFIHLLQNPFFFLACPERIHREIY